MVFLLVVPAHHNRVDQRVKFVKQMHADLVKLGYDGSYERVAAFARAGRDERHRSAVRDLQPRWSEPHPSRFAKFAVNLVPLSGM
ncbi:Mobile element protein [Tritonibacter mobilis]|nr:Mobile element protein [Tritonibacter mobilis]